ncbi:hypothetical protein B005_1266 [Nocardiopsis alba ATCC BAA-2165]|uniref:Uncharacterized protein n=1 Tax=Nocardiopsis alba (strain ATCC BAA-2165 / BE74) TaxID=1205910 RepID=J7L7B4_NOCAA|nr:hypothetical protein B005_1266 [Nocardiopsis alba ATCC BAA-2165]
MFVTPSVNPGWRFRRLHPKGRGLLSATTGEPPRGPRYLP